MGIWRGDITGSGVANGATFTVLYLPRRIQSLSYTRGAFYLSGFSFSVHVCVSLSV